MNVQGTNRMASVICGAVLAACATTAWAQQRASNAPPPERTADTTLAEWLGDKDARISELIGTRVMDPSGEDLGEVEDLLATAGREQNPVVVLSIGGVLDVGDKWYSASLAQLRLAADGERLVLDESKAEVEAAPNFDYVAMMGEQSIQPGVRGPETTNAVGRLLGATVVNQSGDTVGEVQDFVLSTAPRGLRAIVELEESAADGRLVAVPFADLVIELSGEEAGGIPQQPRVRAELEGAPIGELPAYEYPSRELI